VANQSCAVKTSPKGQQYLERKGSTGHSLDWTKAGTKIRINLEKVGKDTNAKDIGAFIDSFRASDSKGAPVKHIDRSII
jgi:hypothetical protein